MTGPIISSFARRDLRREPVRRRRATDRSARNAMSGGGGHHRDGRNVLDRQRRIDDGPARPERRRPHAGAASHLARVPEHRPRSAERHDAEDRRRARRVRRSQQQRLPVPPADRDRNARRRQSCRSPPRRWRRTCRRKLSTILPCTPANASAEAGCASMFITTFGAKAFRRPLTTAETTTLTTLYNTGRTTLALDFNGAIGPAARGDAAVARLPLPLGDGSGAGDQGRRRRAARQLPDRQPAVVLPVGHDAGRDAVHGGGRAASCRRPTASRRR